MILAFTFDGDDDFPPDAKDAIQANIQMTLDMRERWITSVIQLLHSELHQYSKVAVSQAFVLDRFRTQVQQEFPFAKFVWVKADTNLREQRLIRRGTIVGRSIPHIVDITRKNTAVFEEPSVLHKILWNNTDSKDVLKGDLVKVLSSITLKDPPALAGG